MSLYYYTTTTTTLQTNKQVPYLLPLLLEFLIFATPPYPTHQLSLFEHGSFLPAGHMSAHVKIQTHPR